ncbi:MAG TPA: YtxH domain-containing protein [Segetibacter sp.]|jgi:gas vesicle protein
MKSKSVLFLLTGIAIGAIAGALFAPQKTIKKRKGPVKKLNKAKKSLKETASKYKKELRDMENGAKPKATRVTKAKSTGEAEAT